MAKHDRPNLDRRPLSPLLIVGALVLLVAVALGVWALTRGGGGDDPVADPTGPSDGTAATTDGEDAEASTATAAPADCSPVTVWAAPEILPAVQGAAERATDDCFTFTVQERETATALNTLRGGEVPDAWVPGSTAWPQLAAQEGIDLEVGPVIASSPVVLATAPGTVDTLAQLGIGTEATFADVTSTYRELAAAGDAPVTLRTGDPRVDAATMSLLAGTSQESGGWAEDSPESREVLVRLAQTAVQGDPLSAVQSEPTTFVPATEQQLSQAVQDGADLTAVPLAGDASVVQMPLVRLTGDGSTDAVDALQEQLLSPDASGELTALDLRAGADGAAPDVPALPDGLTVAASAPEAGAVTTTAETWAAVAPQSRILTVVDISGSMEAEIDDTTRIDLARDAVQAALEVIPDQTAMGLWYFSTALNGAADHAEQVPLRELGEDAGDGRSQREVLLEVTDELGLETLTGDTGLHDSLWTGYQYMSEQQTPDTISSVLLLTDGINDDSTGGLTEDEVASLLEQGRQSSDSPVTVVLIGMGPDVDEAALERLAEAAGGESFVLRDALELPQVFVDIVARRAP
ncbi:substrate-binding domain-containing protein [Ornithinimicrobium cerasi]|uniref:substrate-binding domain-containing protein n=1 Tax=Ornithinimicrobium cerasi TaxID=2248773 RepID=UPI0014827026|nr:substrate-binding domain-containing protein [Ornithinimicrobium cerasi]